MSRFWNILSKSLAWLDVMRYAFVFSTVLGVLIWAAIQGTLGVTLGIAVFVIGLIIGMLLANQALKKENNKQVMSEADSSGNPDTKDSKKEDK